ncbi:MAG TPA: hypothetical protein VL283_00425 [Candidatus Baltobacteraceae bacterium]|nr:hypothetical protein [Candidatus Baltobacteraceae bacterium]
MKNSFESVDIDVSDFDETPKPDPEKEQLEAIAEKFFKDNPFLKASFGRDEGAMARFRGMLMQEMHSFGRSHGYQDDETHAIDFEAVRADPLFQKQLIIATDAFVEEENRRKKRAA